MNPARSRTRERRYSRWVLLGCVFFFALAALGVSVWNGVAGVAASVSSEPSVSPRSEVRIHFLDVGQGDAVLIESPAGRAVLYDGGERGPVLLDALAALGISALEVVIASHAHADHIGGLVAAVGAMPPRFFMDNGVPHTTQTYGRLMEAVLASGAQLLEPEARTLTLDGVQLHIVPPPGDLRLGHNDNSVGVVVEYGAFRAFLGGDAEAHLWAWWMENHADRFSPVQVHKASHHGSRNGDTAAGVTQLAPEVVVIGTGAGNTYGHPHPEALELYASVGARVYRTDRNGTVTVVADTTGAFSVNVTRGEADESPATTIDLPCVDLNEADVRTLQRLPGVGPALAQGIVEVRGTRPFADVQDLTRVRGIGAQTVGGITASGMVCG